MVASNDSGGGPTVAGKWRSKRRWLGGAIADRYDDGMPWQAMAWWVHDHLPYSRMEFFPKRAAFNLSWREEPERRIDSYAKPVECLTKPGEENYTGDHSDHYPGFPPGPSRSP
ncbi:MAG: hypothetical protein JWP28_661 [Phenylobacterium sp.]|nr:hypothetical protein [Phenylobacterium sp.]